MIDVKHSSGDEWLVTVKSNVTTHHRVRVPKMHARANPLEQVRTPETVFGVAQKFEPQSSVITFGAVVCIGRRATAMHLVLSRPKVRDHRDATWIKIAALPASQ